MKNPDLISLIYTKQFSAVVLFLSLLLSSCYKDKLELKPDISLTTMEKVSDYQLLLNNDDMNFFAPVLFEDGADDYFLNYTIWNPLSTVQRNSYTWVTDVFEGKTVTDWVYCYKRIFYANLVLEGLDKLSSQSATAEYQTLKGIALFHRALAYWQLAQLFAAPYDVTKANSFLGLPLRLKSDVLAIVPRATLAETYSQILSDATEAVKLLPSATPAFIGKTRPNRSAGYMLLARIYLTQHRYDLALNACNEGMTDFNELMDYNLLDKSAALPFPKNQMNKEIIFIQEFFQGNINNASIFVDSLLYRSYANNDLRKQLFFTDKKPSANYKAGYEYEASIKFAGFATDELYITRAECNARLNHTAAALADLNYLLARRYSSTSFVPVTNSDPVQLLQIILTERRRELVFRGIRWFDLRRLNQEGANITLTRNLNGQIYSLPPNSSRYVYPIPKNEMDYNPVIQNERGN